MACVLAKADVGNENQLAGCAPTRRTGLPQSSKCGLHNTAFFPCARTLLILRLRQAKEQQTTETKSSSLISLFYCLIYGEIEDARHGADLFANAFTGADKERIDQLRRSEARFAHQAAQRLSPAHAAHAHERKIHDSILSQDDYSHFNACRRDGQSELLRASSSPAAIAGCRSP